MSDEELVQCPNNPNHQVPRSQINEHVNTCKLLMDPNQEMQIRTSSDDEPRPSTSYQELPQEGSSLQEGSSQQEESQIAELPNLQGPSFHEWRPPKDPTELQEKSSSGLKKPRLSLRSLRNRGILAESEIEPFKLQLKQDKKSSFKKSEMRIESYYKILHEKIKLLEKLKIDSSSDEDSSSSSGSTLSLIDTMPDKKKKILFDMGTEFLEQLRSTSQQTGSSQQESSSPKPKMTGEEILKQTDIERWVIQSSRFMSEVTTPLEVKLEEPPSTGDFLQEQSPSFSVSTKTTHDSDLSQKSKVTEEKIAEKMDTEKKNKAQVSPTLLERITQIEIKLKKLSLAADVSKQQIQSVSSPTETKKDSDRSEKPKMTEEQIPEKMGTEEKNKDQVSPTLSERITQIEIKLEKLSLATDVSKQQLQSVSSPTKTKKDSDRSQKPKMTEEEIPKKIDTEDIKKAKASPTSSEMITQLEIELGEFSLTADVPQQQLQSVSFPIETKQDSDRSKQPKTTKEKKPEEIDTKAKIETEESHTLSEVITQLEVELVEPSLAADVPQQQIQPVSSSTETKQDSDRSQQPKTTKEKKTEEIDIEAKIETEESHTLLEVITQLEVELVEPSLTADVPQQQIQSVSSTETKKDSDRLQQPKKTKEKRPEEIDTEAKIETEESRTLSEVTTQLEVELEEPSLTADASLQQSQPFSFPAATTHDSDVSQQPKIISKTKHEEMDTEAEMETEESHTLSQVTTQLEVESEESSLFEVVPQHFSFPAATTHDSDDSQQSEIISKKKHEEMDTKEKIQTEESHTLSHVTIQVEAESEESSLFEVVPQHFSFPAATTHDSDDSQQSEIISKKKHEEMDTKEKIQTEESHTLSHVTIHVEAESEESSLLEVVPQRQSQHFSFPAATTHDSEDLQRPISSMKEKYAENIGEEMTDAEVSHILATETNLQLIKTEEPSSSRAVPGIIATDHGETTNVETPQADISQQESSSLQEDSLLQGGCLQQEDSSQPKERRRPETSDIWKFLHSVGIDSPEPILTLYEEDEDLQPLTHRECSSPETDDSQGRDRLTIRSSRRSRGSTDIDNLQKERKSPEADISSESDSSRRKTKFLQIKRGYHSSSTSDEDEDEKIDLENPSSSSPKKRSKPVGSRGKTKHQLDVPPEASRQRKRSHETSSESTDIDSGDLPKSGRSPKSAISPEADSSQRKKKFLEIRRRFETASTKDEDNDKKIDSEEPSTSSLKKQSKPVVSRGKTKHQLDVQQEASRLRKRSHETSSESTDIDVSDFQKSTSSRKSAISPEADSSQRKKKFLEIRRRFEAASTKDKDSDEQIDLDKPSTSSSTKQSKPVISPGKTKHQLDVPQEASRLRKRSYETSSEDTDIDVDDIPIADSPPKSDTSPKGDGSQRKKKFLEIGKRYDPSSKKDEDKDEKKGI